MDFPIQMATKRMGLSFKGATGRSFQINVFQSLKIVLIIANSADPDGSSLFVKLPV